MGDGKGKKMPLSLFIGKHKIKKQVFFKKIESRGIKCQKRNFGRKKIMKKSRDFYRGN